MAIVTVSRMYGSGGSEVAAGIARELGWDLLDNALVDEIADRLGVSHEDVEAREERLPSLAERLAAALSLTAPEMLITGEHQIADLTEERIVAVTQRVVEEAAARDHVVLVGRGAQCMLASRSDALHVFCYAPPAALTARAAARLGVPQAEAARAVEQTNRDREQYVKRHWNRAWRGIENYHLCCNTDWLGIEGTIRLVVEAARTRL
ncbi:MAG: cytidylate kinase-like family protein [Gemmatimonadaceae bacterium]|nr:cytidylate kinase-like family protein [Gemmatimonadaceae bacterium]NUR20249.1 cytidylate kinase-like family protein [Gemmatimonadaceae bacterium]NUS98205.1 cytidylate kinase-like family protein [Gemmatimonadaceae bacterium]